MTVKNEWLGDNVRSLYSPPDHYAQIRAPNGRQIYFELRTVVGLVSFPVIWGHRMLFVFLGADFFLF